MFWRRLRRWGLLIGLLLCALALHTGICEWGFGSQYTEVRARICTYVGDNGIYGVVGRRGVSPAEAMCQGIVLPFGMVLTVGYLILYWREADRLAAGRCIDCGHQTRVPLACSECGAQLRVAKDSK